MTRPRAIIITGILVLAIFALVFLIYTQTKQFKMPELPAVTPGYYPVAQVIDGDTIDITMNSQTERVRLIGVDTPETKKPDAPVQCFGPQASDYTKKLLTGKSVRLESDPKSDNRDRYGRLLRYVYTQDGTLLDQDLIQKGYGFAYVLFDFDKKIQFEAAQQTAQTSHRGLWGTCAPTKSGQKWNSNDL